MDYITIGMGKGEGKLLNIGELYAVLSEVEDKRKEKGKRYTIGILLMVVILAKLCGENRPYGIAEWVKAHQNRYSGRQSNSLNRN